MCKLLKSLYGLRQAPRNWFKKLTDTLISLGYVQSQSDASLFTVITATSTTLVLIYVDDILIAGDTEAEIFNLKNMLSHVFHMKDLGYVNYFLGLEIDRSSAGFFVSQRKYVRNLLKEFHMDLATPVRFHLIVT